MDAPRRRKIVAKYETLKTIVFLRIFNSFFLKTKQLLPKVYETFTECYAPRVREEF